MIRQRKMEKAGNSVTNPEYDVFERITYMSKSTNIHPVMYGHWEKICTCSRKDAVSLVKKTTEKYITIVNNRKRG